MAGKDDDDFFFRDRYFPPSVPRKVKGGIKARSGRGAFGRSWWAKRWIAVLEGFHIGARLGRGKSYARKGQVLSINVEKGEVTAEVQGSRPKPYHVRIGVRTLTAAQWGKVARRLSAEPVFAAGLLAGEVPEDIESVFLRSGVPLFPEQYKDLTTSCSCPDWSNPCKHIAAVYYLLGEEFDRDPFLLIRLRGMNREEFVGLLTQGSARTQGEPESLAEPKPRAGRRSRAGPRSREGSTSEASPAEPLPTDAASFWHGRDLPDGLFGEVRTPPVPAATLKRLGGFPFWRGDAPLQETLEPLYPVAARRGLEVFLRVSLVDGGPGHPLNWKTKTTSKDGQSHGSSVAQER
ncbi:MAG: SWIM zinc finger family protein [Bacillota bacterium]